jgi:hypothetical protein
VAWPEVAPPRSRRRAHCRSGPNEGEGNAGQQAAVGALLGPRGGAELLDWRWALAEGGARRGGDGNGGGGRRPCARAATTGLYIAEVCAGGEDA